MKFSIVTPAYNSEKFIAETIESVISQKGDFSIEYIIMDNCSIDRTLTIVEGYRRSLKSGVRKIHCRDICIHLFSERDSGMYDAINEGFSRSTGDVCAWLNSDDIYLPGALSCIQCCLKNFSEIHWIKGITSYIGENATIYSVGKCHLYVQGWIKEGLYGSVLHFIQQDSVFWRSNLWELVKDEISDYSLAGDYIIWRRFAEHYALYSLKAYVSCFRKVSGQKSEAIDKYWEEALTRMDVNKRLASRIRRYKRLMSQLPSCMRPIFRIFMYKSQIGHLVVPGDSDGSTLIEGSLGKLKKELA